MESIKEKQKQNGKANKKRLTHNCKHSHSYMNSSNYSAVRIFFFSTVDCLFDFCILFARALFTLTN